MRSLKYNIISGIRAIAAASRKINHKGRIKVRIAQKNVGKIKLSLKQRRSYIFLSFNLTLSTRNDVSKYNCLMAYLCTNTFISFKEHIILIHVQNHHESREEMRDKRDK